MNVKNLVLGIGIIVIYALALWQGIEAFYPSPQYDKFCTAGRFEGNYFPAKPLPSGEPSCNFSRNLQEEQNRCYAEKGQPIFEYDDKGCTISIKECDYCQKEFEEAQEVYSMRIFIIAFIIGIITLIVGYSILSIEPVGSALIGSGVWAIFYGAAINWRNFSNIWRFLLLLVALVVIIYVTMRLNREREKKGFWERLGLKR